MSKEKNSASDKVSKLIQAAKEGDEDAHNLLMKLKAMMSSQKEDRLKIKTKKDKLKINNWHSSLNKKKK